MVSSEITTFIFLKIKLVKGAEQLRKSIDESAAAISGISGTADAAVDTEEDGVINDQVKRILKPRMKEFYDWIDLSENELRKRFNIEKNYNHLDGVELVIEMAHFMM